MTFRFGTRRGLGSLALLALGLTALTACSMPIAPAVSTAPTQDLPSISAPGSATRTPASSAPAIPSDTQKPTPEPSVGIELSATIVVAGVDPDGAHVSASGYVVGAVENGGTCTFTFTGGGSPVTVSSSGMADRSTTSCGLVQATIDRFTPGSWNVVLTYSSATSSATSAPQSLEIK